MYEAHQAALSVNQMRCQVLIYLQFVESIRIRWQTLAVAMTLSKIFVTQKFTN